MKFSSSAAREVLFERTKKEKEKLVEKAERELAEKGRKGLVPLAQPRPDFENENKAILRIT
jgi:hypothetical protein